MTVKTSCVTDFGNERIQNSKSDAAKATSPTCTDFSILSIVLFNCFLVSINRLRILPTIPKMRITGSITWKRMTRDFLVAWPAVDMLACINSMLSVKLRLYSSQLILVFFFLLIKSLLKITLMNQFQRKI